MRLDQPVLLYGAGREARSTAHFLKARQPELKLFVTVDSGEASVEGAEFLPASELDRAIAERRIGLIVKSPGVSRYKPIFATAEAAGIPITSNLNLWGAFYREGRMVIAITGTKGKSTTATLTHLMLTHSGVDAGLAGNVGLAPLEIADRHQTVIFELSSYQTADMDFLPDIAGVTNLYPEHVDGHGSTERYFSDKLHLIDREGGFRVALGAPAATNPLVLKALRDPARLLPNLEPEHLARIDRAAFSSRLKGAHNLDNAYLAARIAWAAGGTIAGIVDGIAAFEPLPHRLADHAMGGKVFVDDSISTTPEATKAALAAYRGQRIALIAGGHERQQDYEELATLLAENGVTVLACLPDTGYRLAEAAQRHAPEIIVIEETHLDRAMSALHRHKDLFDTVILSPGAPSYNQFKNFEERGDRFIELAKAIFTE